MELLSRASAFLLIFILSPLFIIISILSIIFQGFPIFFKQNRVGKNFNIFQIVKFRTMISNNGQKITAINDKRITRWGFILRKFKIDELPQLFNIIKGEMRFIGPRPEVPEYFNQHEFKFLNIVKPGISDFSSIMLRNEDVILRTIGGDNPYETLLPVKVQLANYYSNNKSLILDLKLVILTIISIFFPNYASKLLINSDLVSIAPDLKKILIK